MEKQSKSSLFSPSRRELWRQVEPSIWSSSPADLDHEPALSVLKTLFDQPRWLEPYHLYDARGSELFEQICELPEYYLTRTESAILAEKAEAVIRFAPAHCIAELGAGSSKKTLYLLSEQLRQRGPSIFAPIDVSLTGLRMARDGLRAQLPQLAFHGLHARYETGICSIEKNLPTLFVFLGSTVGNFNRSEFVRFFQRLSECMGPQDHLLLGADRVKDREILERAYNDPQGITAEFILNVFRNLNRLLGSNFEARKMRYHSWYNPEWQQVEMYVISAETQKIDIPSLKTSFVWGKGEKILVEISRKFDPDRLQTQLSCFGLDPVAHFTDPMEWFSLLLFRKARAA